LVVSTYWLGIDTIPCSIGIVLVQLIGFDLGFSLVFLPSTSQG
jgi:hypothetical protein